MLIWCYLKFLLAHSHVDVSAPDDESLAGILLAGYGPVS